jgi:hypothetical protein
VLGGDAAVHHDGETALAGDSGRFVVYDPELQPEHLGADRDRLLRDFRCDLSGAENVDDVDSLRDVGKRREDRLTEDLFAEAVGIYGDDFVASVLHVFGNTVARPPWVVGEPNDGNDLRCFEDSFALFGCYLGRGTPCGHKRSFTLWPAMVRGQLSNEPIGR